MYMLCIQVAQVGNKIFAKQCVKRRRRERFNERKDLCQCT